VFGRWLLLLCCCCDSKCDCVFWFSFGMHRSVDFGSGLGCVVVQFFCCFLFVFLVLFLPFCVHFLLHLVHSVSAFVWVRWCALLCGVRRFVVGYFEAVVELERLQYCAVW